MTYKLILGEEEFEDKIEAKGNVEAAKKFAKQLNNIVHGRCFRWRDLLFSVYQLSY